MNLLDAAVANAETEYLNQPRQPSNSELKRATELVQRMLTGQASWTDQIVLRNLLNGMGTSFEQVAAVIREEY